MEDIEQLTPTPKRAPTGDPLRFFRNVALEHVGDDCLIWPYSTVKGYAQIRINGRMALVHRLSCEFLNGPSPSRDHEAAHRCGNKACVNPHHLRWATPAENSADRVLHGTHPSGELNPRAKITKAEAIEIKRLKGAEKQVSLAKRFGISQPTVSQIQRERLWPLLSKTTGGNR